jgi:hypothetical protein
MMMLLINILDIVMTIVVVIALHVLSPTNATFFVFVMFFLFITRLIIDSILNIISELNSEPIQAPLLRLQYASRLMRYRKFFSKFNRKIIEYIKSTSYWCLLIVLSLHLFSFMQHLSYTIAWIAIILYLIYISCRCLLYLLYMIHNTIEEV